MSPLQDGIQIHVSDAWRPPFLIAMAAWLIAGGLALQQYRRFAVATLTLEQTDAVRDAIDQVVTRLIDDENGHRGYLLTRDRSLLQPSLGAGAQVRALLARLRRLAANNPVGEAAARRLTTLAERKLDEMADALTLLDSDDIPGATARISSGESTRVMDDIRAVAADMRAVERSLLAEHVNQARLAERGALGFAVASLTVVLALGLYAVSVHRDFERRRVAHSMEMTARLAAQRQALDATADLQLSGSLNRSIFDNSADCITVLEPDGRVVLSNRPAVAVMEIDNVNEGQGQAWASLWNADASTARQAMAEAVAGGEGRFQAVRPIGRGTPKWWDVIVTPIRDETGDVLKFVTIARDITDQKLADEDRAQLLASERAARVEAEHAARMTDDFVNTLSHELRTPLNAILGWVGVLRQDQTPETLATAIDVIDRNSHRQSKLIGDLLDMSRIVSGRSRPDERPADTLQGVPAQFADLLDGVAVLVLDDEPDARDFVQRLLEDAGARVTAADTTQKAVSKLEQGLVPDIILSDIGMPGADGYEFMRRVRGMYGGLASVPAVALTALARVEDRRRALMAGYQTHLAKPVDPAELVAMVASLTGRTGNWSA